MRAVGSRRVRSLDHISDLDVGVTCTLSKGRERMQAGLDRLEKWAARNRVQRNKDTCRVLHRGRKTIQRGLAGGLSDGASGTFGRVRRLWESRSAAHKEICAVLAAVTEVIRAQGGKETETEYFAALMTTMEAVESTESLAAVAYLLNLVLKRVPAPVLRKKFSDASKAFMSILASQAGSSSTSALRWVVSCLATLLRKQDLAAWSYPVTLQVYHGLLSFTVHAKPKVRKAAQHGICSVLKGSECLFGDAAPEHHPAARSTAKFCVQEIEKAGGTKEATTTLHVLTLLRDLLPCLPAAATKSCCEALLRVMTLGHVLVTACAMQAFHGFFSAQPSPACLPAELNAQIITALYDYVPSESDLQPTLAWLAVMERAHVNLVGLQKELCWGHLPRLFTAAMTCLLSPHPQVLSATAQTLKVPAPGRTGPPTSCPCRAVEEGLTYRFHAAWAPVLQVLRAFFEACGKQGHPVMRKCLRSLCDLRLSPHFPYTAELDETVGAAVGTMGPEVVLEAMPLGIDGREETLDFPRSWLLPVLRDHIRGARLGSQLILSTAAVELAQDGKTLESKIYDTLQGQVWSLLPGFCRWPTDVVSSFKGLARTLGTALSERPDLRLPVCQALRTLITKGCQTDAERTEVGRFAKNFLPILFNVYSQPGDDGRSSAHRRAVLDTVRTYLTVTEQQLVCGFLQKASEKLSSPDSSEFTRLSILDLIVAMAPYADEPTLGTLYRTIQPSLQTKEHGVQKKAYRVLEEVCAASHGPCQAFIRSNLGELKTVLLDSLKSAASPAKRPRLKCLLHIVKQLTAEDEAFITALVPEVVLCTKEVSVGARKNAFALLVEMGEAFLRFGPAPQEAMQRFLLLAYAGLTGSVTMISCTLLALTRLLFEFKGKAGTGQLLQSVCLLLGSRTRDVVKAALGFLKAALLLVDIKLLTAHLEAVGALSDDMRRHFRTKLKNLFTKFIRKFGFELVQGLLPATHHKVLLNIRKAEGRGRRQRALRQAAAREQDPEALPRPRGDSMEEVLADSDEEEEEERGPRQPQGQAWLKEGAGDEPLNFLDSNVAQRVLATRPGSSRAGRASHDFGVSEDGRLIIREDEDEDGEESRARGWQLPQAKGRGDVKKAGRPDPYAYIPLNRAKLNRRKKAKLQGQFKGLMKGAQRGAQAGRRHRPREPSV
uniref:Ribosomal RNA processing 12 homolog n=1 Tax=Crocodylus porosus TaxID=8502 RepID=A0A7M4F4E7_CROPO